ncbi:MAG: hypothetical protein ABUL72_05920 [Armatimonadota bacterium]
MLNWFPALLLLLLQTTACPEWSGSWSTSAMTRIQVASIVATVSEEGVIKPSSPAPVTSFGSQVEPETTPVILEPGAVAIPAAPILLGSPSRAGPSFA